MTEPRPTIGQPKDDAYGDGDYSLYLPKDADVPTLLAHVRVLHDQAADDIVDATDGNFVDEACAARATARATLANACATAALVLQNEEARAAADLAHRAFPTAAQAAARPPMAMPPTPGAHAQAPVAKATARPRP